MAEEAAVDSDGQEREPLDSLEVRQHVQQIITSSVVHKDSGQTQLLIQEGLDAYGYELAHCVASFISHFVAESVVKAVATDRFNYLLTRCGDVLELLAAVLGLPEREVFEDFAGRDYVFGTTDDEDPREIIETAMRGTQTCLIAHYFVRRGAPPWGIQSALRLEDMCHVVIMLGFLLHEAVDTFPRTALPAVIDALLTDVLRIISVQAHARDIPVSRYVAEYFTDLAANDAR